jgi:hypothetical protein
MQEIITPAKVLALWQKGEISVDTTLTYMLQNQIRQETTLIAANISWAKVRADLDRLIGQSGLEPERQSLRLEDETAA